MIKMIMIMMMAMMTIGNYKSNEGIYPTTGVVVGVDQKEDMVQFYDFNGQLWAFYGAEDWMNGDIVSVIMNDMGTENIYDDEIVSVKYSGYINNK